MATKETQRRGKFAALAERAQPKARKRRGPYVLGEDEGFDPPITITHPDLVRQEELANAQRINDVFGMVRALAGPENFQRIRNALNDDPIGDAILAELSRELITHFYGEGAGDVEGGSEGS